MHNEDDAAACVHHAKSFNERQASVEGAYVADSIPEPFIVRVAKLARTEFQPFCAFFGGVAAQEVVKYAGKFSPLDGWLYLDAFAAIPEELPAEETKLPAGGSRYDHSISLFGQSFFNKVSNLNVFVVGSGALGCEYLKALALMGVGTGSEGLVTVTDMDTIEVRHQAIIVLFCLLYCLFWLFFVWFS